MSYQIPQSTQAEILLGDTKSPMYLIKPQKGLKAENCIVTMYIRGHLGSDFKMRVNLYKDRNGNRLMISSNVVNNLDIERTGDQYCELRFDFPTAGNLLAIGVNHLIEFEIFDGYTHDADNYVALIMSPFGAMAYLGSGATPLPVADESKPAHKISLFLAEIETQSDEKFFMVRIEGAKLLNGLYTVQNLGPFFNNYLYEATIQKGLFIDGNDSEGFKITGETKVGDGELTRVYEPITPGGPDWDVGNDTYYYDPVTGYIQFYTKSLLSNGSVAVLKYYLFFTNHRGRYADPFMEELPLVTYWEPRLKEGLSFGFSQENNFSGLLSISASSIELKNNDRYLNGFFSANDSFSNRQVKVWKCEGTVKNYTLEFVGTIRAAALNDQNCTFDIQDSLATLDKSYEDDRPVTFAGLSYAVNLISEEERAKVIPRMFGRRGPYDSVELDTAQEISSGYTYKIRSLDGSKMTQLVNVSRNDTIGTSNNRTWSIGFGPSTAGSLGFNCTSHTQITIGTSFQASRLVLDHVGIDTVNNYFAVGDTFKNGTQYGIVYEVDDDSIYVWPYNASFSAANDVFREKIPAVIINRDGALFYPIAVRDYTCSIGSDGDAKITFVNNFEANHSGLGTLDPTTDLIYGRAYNDGTSGKATAIIQDIALKAGLTVGPSFAPDQDPSAPDAYRGMSYPDPYLSFTLPYVGDSEMPTFRDVLELLIKTSMGFLYFDPEGNVRYKSFMDTSETNQSGVDGQLNGISEKNSTEVSIRFDLYDLCAGVQFNLTHNPRYGFTEGNMLDGAKEFYKTNKKYFVDIVADRGASYFSNYTEKYVKLVCGRRLSVNLKAFKAKSVFLGDDLLISRTKIDGEQDSSTMRIVSISKEVNSQRMTLLDLKRFPNF